MEHPNGIRIRGEYMYVTQSYLHPVKDPSGKLVSCVYRFRLDEHDIDITNTLEDPHILTTFITQNPKLNMAQMGLLLIVQEIYMLEILVMGEVWKLVLNQDGSLKEKESLCQKSRRTQKHGRHGV